MVWLQDSLTNVNNLYKVQGMTFEQELKDHEDAKLKAEASAARSRNIQFGIIALIVLTLGIFLLVFSRTAVVGAKAIKNLSPIALLLFFEFINLLLHPFLDRITNHSPILMLLCMAAIAGAADPAAPPHGEAHHQYACIEEQPRTIGGGEKDDRGVGVQHRQRPMRKYITIARPVVFVLASMVHLVLSAQQFVSQPRFDSLRTRYDLSRPPQERYWITSNHRWACWNRGLKQEARQSAKEELELAEQLQVDTLLANAYDDLSGSFIGSSESALQLKYSQKALEHANASGSHDYIGTVQKGFASIYKPLGDFPLARLLEEGVDQPAPTIADQSGVLSYERLFQVDGASRFRAVLGAAVEHCDQPG
ncbi:MAG: hypothetical protein IPJ87_16820 [Flavobacteriales bacterium]|nr:hypothetical protein [Flavobacteriales bacterium]